jgi:hypothetical protein
MIGTITRAANNIMTYIDVFISNLFSSVQSLGILPLYP